MEGDHRPTEGVIRAGRQTGVTQNKTLEIKAKKL